VREPASARNTYILNENRDGENAPRVNATFSGKDSFVDNFTFALPSIASTGMSKDDQGALIVNQATAVIVASFLNYLAATYPSMKGDTSITDVSLYRINQNELGSLIDAVQDALKSF
jgi:hypothetical protein